MALEKALIDRYGVDSSGPYYTSYPTLGEWSDTFTEHDFAAALEAFIAHDGDRCCSRKRPPSQQFRGMA
jgi:hypothetical protein